MSPHNKEHEPSCPVHSVQSVHEFSDGAPRDFDSSPDATLEFAKSEEGRDVCIYANNAAHLLFRYSPGELLGTHLDDFVPASVRAQHASLVESFRISGATTRAMGEAGRLQKGVRRDGTEFECSISIYKKEGGRVIGAIVKPEGKAAEIIRQQNERLKEQVRKTSEAYEELQETSLARRQLDGNNEIIKWMLCFVAYGLAVIFFIAWKIPESLQVIPHVREIITVTISFIGGYLAKGAIDALSKDGGKES